MHLGGVFVATTDCNATAARNNRHLVPRGASQVTRQDWRAPSKPAGAAFNEATLLFFHNQPSGRRWPNVRSGPPSPNIAHALCRANWTQRGETLTSWTLNGAWEFENLSFASSPRYSRAAASLSHPSHPPPPARLWRRRVQDKLKVNRKLNAHLSDS